MNNWMRNHEIMCTVSPLDPNLALDLWLCGISPIGPLPPRNTDISPDFSKRSLQKRREVIMAHRSPIYQIKTHEIHNQIQKKSFHFDNHQGNFGKLWAN